MWVEENLKTRQNMENVKEDYDSFEYNGANY